MYLSFDFSDSFNMLKLFLKKISIIFLSCLNLTCINFRIEFVRKNSNFKNIILGISHLKVTFIHEKYSIY